MLDGFLAFAKELGIKDLTPDWQLPISAEHQAWAKEKIGGKPTLLICAAASRHSKIGLPPAAPRWRITPRQGLSGLSVRRTGRAGQDLAAEIQRLSQSKPEDLVGQTSLKQLLALIGEASLVLAPDTGPAHMATLVGTPVIGLYAHHNPSVPAPICAGIIWSAPIRN